MGRGRGKRGRTQRRDFRDGRENVWKKPRGQEDDAGESGWTPFLLENAAFDAYYKKQGIMAEDEWDQFKAALHKPLPTTFRINGGGQFAHCIRDQMRRDFFDYLKDETEIAGEVIEPVRALPWYPDDLAWHLSFSRAQLRKVPILQRIHEFLKQENELGNITRQEAVSMVPPLFLDVQPHHHVLDMCAAPGSKTFQLLEVIHGENEPAVLPKGLVIANDSDVQRCHLLIHQTKRMCSPNILVTNHEAQHFPGLKKKRVEVDMKDVESDVAGLTFDRVLCDVPCSGDGTMRKAPDLWKKWNSGMGNGLHCLQIQIAMRGVALLRVGGRMVYSTCSLNPVEDEAVVGEIIRQSEGSMELLDVSSELPDLKRRVGLKSWKVRGKRIWFSSYQEDKNRTVLPSMFPSGKRMAQIKLEEAGKETDIDQISKNADSEQPEDIAEEFTESEGEVSELPLDRCMRILPHDQDTGGFFIAVLKKVRPYKCVPKSTSEKKKNTTSAKLQKEDEPLAGCVETQVEEPVDPEENDSGAGKGENPQTLDQVEEPEEPVENDSGTGKGEKSQPVQLGNQKQKGRSQKQGPWLGVDPILFLEDEHIITSLMSYYGIKDSLPLRGHLIVRNEDTSRVKRIYYVSKSASDVVRLNFQAGEMLKITSAGLKIFERHSNKENASACAFRIASEGLPLLLPHLTKQLLYAPKEDFKLLLSPNPVNFAAFKDPTFSNAVQSLLVGCCVVVLKNDDGAAGDDITAVGCWRGRTNMSLLVPRVEADQILQRLYPKEDTQDQVDVADGDVAEEQKEKLEAAEAVEDPEEEAEE